MTVKIEDGIPWIDGVYFGWAKQVDVEDCDYGAVEPGFVRHIRRFLLTFENGWNLSVVFGDGTYGDNHFVFGNGEFKEEVEEVELAVWFRDEEMIRWPNGDNVVGHVPSADVLELIEIMKWLPSNARAIEQTQRSIMKRESEPPDPPL